VFRHHIKDLLIGNAVVAVAFGLALASSNSPDEALLLVVLVVMILGPLVWVETYLYRKKKGAWYRWKHPRKLARGDLVTDEDRLLRYPRILDPDRSVLGAGEPGSNPRPRTRLFESSSPSEPVSRASLLLAVASKLEKSGRMDAAAMVYRQILQDFACTTPARDAAHRLGSVSPKKGAADRSREN
jgi:hypothetical protein